HAFTMVTKEEGKYWKAIESLIKKDVPFFDLGEVPQDSVSKDRPERARSEQRTRRESSSDRKPRARTPEPVAAEVAQPVKAEAPRPVQKPAGRTADAPAPRTERAARPPRHDRHPSRDVGDAPDARGFHEGNMPAFLMRSVRAG
ncbi:MAG: hypothetical protein KDK89_17405, partial [Alphaproteobacteria bacterium]|nr:hypothetical protein [Alphaproteobacteria bacterium]